MGDVGMVELCQDLAFDFQPRLNSARVAINYLDGHLLLELSVRPLGQVNLAHAAHPQGAEHSIRPYAISFHA